MKGIVFTKFLEMVEQRYSADIVDDLIDALGADADADGSYTAVSYYAHHRFLTLVETLATKTGQSKHACCVEFGDYLIADLAKLFPDFFNGHPDVFSFLTLIGQVIEDEVKKLYPETNHPELSVIEQDGTRLVVNLPYIGPWRIWQRAGCWARSTTLSAVVTAHAKIRAPTVARRSSP